MNLNTTTKLMKKALTYASFYGWLLRIWDWRIYCRSVKMVRNFTKGAGNAIVPQVAAEILRCMMRVDFLHNAEVCQPEGAKKL